MIVIRNPSSAYTDSRVQYSHPESRTVLAAKLTCSVFLFDYCIFSVKLPCQISPLPQVRPPLPFQGKKVNKPPFPPLIILH